MTPEQKIEFLKEVLEKARNGIEWWKNEYPQSASTVDDEMLDEIDQALSL